MSRPTLRPATRLLTTGTAVALLTGGLFALAAPAEAAAPAASPAVAPLATSDAASPGITVSAYNVHKSSSGPSWSGRRQEVADNITSQSPDVIALAEATPASVTVYGAKVKQYNDLLNLIDNHLPYKYAAAGNYTNATKLAYNSNRLKVLKQGSKILKKLGSQRRYAVWATFSDLRTGKRLFVVATHLEPGKSTSKTTKYNTVRISQAKQILSLVKDKNPKKHPVVIAGDFNSSRSTEPSNGPYNVFVKGGMIDPLDNAKAGWAAGDEALAEKLVDVEYNSANKWERVAPRTKFDVGTNVDYVMVSKGVRVSQYQTVVRVDSEGRFIGTIPSDHNQIKAVVHLP